MVNAMNSLKRKAKNKKASLPKPNKTPKSNFDKSKIKTLLILHMECT